MKEIVIKGNFSTIDNKPIINDITCKFQIDFFNIMESKISFLDIKMSNSLNAFIKNQSVIFKNEDYYMELTSTRLEFLHIFNAEFQIDRLIVLNEYSDEITYESGLIESLILRLPHNYIIENEKFIIKPVYLGRSYYWRIISKEFIDLEELTFIFGILSSITASFFTYRMITNNNMQKEYYWKISKSSRFYEIDNLKETYYIDFHRIYNNKNERNVISKILAEYTFSITRESIEHRFFKCMNLLDYIIELSSIRGKNQSLKLKKILNKILSYQEEKHILKLIPYYDDIKIVKNNDVSRIFDFYLYRNHSYHRGYQLINKEDINILLYCLHVVNEVLRILISNFDKINFKKKKFDLNIELIPTVKEIKMITKELNQCLNPKLKILK